MFVFPSGAVVPIVRETARTAPALSWAARSMSLAVTYHCAERGSSGPAPHRTDDLAGRHFHLELRDLGLFPL